MVGKMAKPNYDFELDLKDIETIEYCLGKQINVLAKRHWTHPETSIENFEKIKEIQEILSKIHNQKIWYMPVEKIAEKG
mgnify:CR=1 FL=1